MSAHCLLAPADIDIESLALFGIFRSLKMPIVGIFRHLTYKRMEGVIMDQGSAVCSPKLSTMPRRSLSVLPKYWVTSPSLTKPFPAGCRADVSSCSVAKVAAKVPEESGKTKLVQNVNKPSVAMLANKYDCCTAKHFNISGKKDDKQSDTGKIIII